MLERKSVATVIILTLVTFGIYGLVWTYKTAKALYQPGTSGSYDPVLIIVLCIFLSPVGYILFALSADSGLNAVRVQRGLQTKDNQVLYIILAVIITFVLIGIVQNDINELA